MCRSVAGCVAEARRARTLKRLDLIERAVARVDGIEIEFVGPTLSEQDRAYRATLGRTRDAVAWVDIPALLEEYDALVSATEAGSADKVVYEAAASCLPVLVSSPAFASLVPPELRFAGEDDLVDRLSWLASADRAALGRELREHVVRDHSVDAWAERTLEALA